MCSSDLFERDVLQNIALKRTGGAKTDEILGHESGPEGLPHSIIVTPEGTEGEAPALLGTQNGAAGNGAGAAGAEVPAPEATKSKAPGRKSKTMPTKRKKR